MSLSVWQEVRGNLSNRATDRNKNLVSYFIYFFLLVQEHGIKDASEIIFEMSKDERKDFYRTIAWGLNRPLFAVYRRVLRMYDDRNHVGK